MHYTKARLEHALLVYREAKLQEAKLKETEAAFVKRDRKLRSSGHVRQGTHSSRVKIISTCQSDEVSSDTNYDPRARKKRRLPANASRRSRPAKKKSTTGGSRQVTSSSTELKHPDGEVSTTAEPFVTPKLKSSSARTLVTSFSNRIHSDDRSGVANSSRLHHDFASAASLKPEQRDQKRNLERQRLRSQNGTYLERMDKESSSISRGQLRSGRTLPANDLLKNCVPCTEEKQKCPCEKSEQESAILGLDQGVKCIKLDLEEVSPREETKEKSEEDRKQTTANTPSPPQDSEAPNETSKAIRGCTTETQQMFAAPVGNSIDNPIVIDSPPPSPSPSISPDGKSRDQTFTIQTFWAHPVNFKHLPSPGLPCHFCADFRYGIYGYGLRLVEVIKFLDSVKFSERRGGHRSEGREPTRMCVPCSLSRLHISRCKNHKFQRSGVSSHKRLQEYANQVLADDWKPTLKTGVYPTCALCPQAAFWKCCATQRFDKFGRRLSDEGGRGKGCGLMLCDGCWGKATDGILRKPSVEDASLNDYSGGARADMEFLFPGSLLHEAFGEYILRPSTR